MSTPDAESTGPRPHVDRIQTALRAATIGEYDIAGEIGRGGMAVVFLAHDLSLNRKVAIKALLPELLYTEGMDRRFKHEARIAAKLDHPNILVIHGVREANELLFIVMKLVEGLPLSAIVKAAGPLPIPLVRFIVSHVADALSYAHGEGVVHRDVKPANIMVDRRGNVIVMDFGIAKAADDAHLTRTGLVIGTPAYMSPEQCLAQGVAPASDQYSLGVVAYELLTGRTPFRGSALEMQWSHATAGPPTVRSLRPDCPPELESLVLRMLAKAPADRWPTLHDVSHALSNDPTTVAAARAALVTLVSESPARRDAALPSTPASPVPIGPGPMAAGDATTDPARRTSDATPAAADAFSPSGETPAPNADVIGPLLTLSQQRIEIAAGDAVELIVELEGDDRPSDGSTVLWQTSNPSVATISADGFVTAVAPGLAEITCGWHGRRAVCLVHVTPAAVVAAASVPIAAVAAAAPPAPPAPRRPEVVTRAPSAVTPPATSPMLAPRKRWWVGVLAAGLATFALYRGTRFDSPAASVPTGVAAATPRPVASAPAPAPDTTRPTQAASLPPAEPPAALPAPKNPPPNAEASRPPTPTVRAPTAASVKAAPSSAAAAIPTVPLARPDTSRLTSVRSDTGTGYGATRPTPPPVAPTTSTTAPVPAPAPARDSVERLPAATRDIANALYRDFASYINSRTYSRITAAYSEPSTAAEVKLWQEFLIFVRDYTPRATVRSVSVDSSTTPSMVTGTIDFRWATDAGFERIRSVTFVGAALPVTGAWQLHRARLTKKFW
ncbi:MAG TPA: protein kinase [Gemmatimonadaceae bacterium]|nr:protein kinase [Gemmatimonadaceae bacterium]